MGPTWVLSAPDGPHDGPMNLGIRDYIKCNSFELILEYQETIITFYYLSGDMCVVFLFKSLMKFAITLMHLKTKK